MHLGILVWSQLLKCKIAQQSTNETLSRNKIQFAQCEGPVNINISFVDLWSALTERNESVRGHAVPFTLNHGKPLIILWFGHWRWALTRNRSRRNFQPDMTPCLPDICKKHQIVWSKLKLSGNCRVESCHFWFKQHWDKIVLGWKARMGAPGATTFPLLFSLLECSWWNFCKTKVPRSNFFAPPPPKKRGAQLGLRVTPNSDYRARELRGFTFCKTKVLYRSWFRIGYLNLSPAVPCFKLRISITGFHCLKMELTNFKRGREEIGLKWK